MTEISAALTEGEAALTAAGIDNPRNQARLLLGHVLGITPAQVFARADDDIASANLKTYYALLSARCEGTPLAHLTGRREFWSMDFHVTPATLIPRPDTETLVELVESAFKDRSPPKTILDLGTGSGCILMALLSVFEDADGVGLDMSKDACRIASANARALGFEKRARIVEGTWEDGIDGTFDLIVSNPPYIPSADIEMLDVDVRAHEPMGALDGGADGLDTYRSLIPAVIPALSDDGMVVFEVGIGQADEVLKIASVCGLIPGPRRKDLAGIERAVSFYKKGVGIVGSRV